VALDMIANCDETAWRIIPDGLLTWAPVGRDGVLLQLDGKEKDSVTVLASITANLQLSLGVMETLFHAGNHCDARRKGNQMLRGQVSTMGLL
jgi:hypothetical protein